MATQIPLEIAIQAKNNASAELNNVSSSLGNIRGQLAGITASAGAFAAVGAVAIREVVSTSLEADTAFREVRTLISDINDEDFAGLRRGIRAIATDLGVDLNSTIAATYSALSAGVPRDNVLDFVRIATKSSIGGVTDTNTAVVGLVSTLNAFGFDASQVGRIADIFFTTIERGQLTFEELSGYLFRVNPLASALGISFEEVSASLAAITTFGVPVAQASTALSSLFSALASPTDDLKQKLEELGYDGFLPLLGEKGFIGALLEISKQYEGDIDGFIRALGTKEALLAVLGITAGEGAVALGNLEANLTSVGSADTAFEIISEGDQKSLDRFNSTLTDLKVVLGDLITPLLVPFVDNLKIIVANVTQWVEDNPELAKTIASVTVIVIGAAAAFAGLVGTFLALSFILPLVLSPLGLVAAALVALITIAGYLILRYENLGVLIYDVAIGLLGAIQGIGGALIKGLLTPIDLIFQGVGALLEQINKLATSGFGEFLNLPTIPDETIEFVRSIADLPANIIGDQIDNAQDAIRRQRDSLISRQTPRRRGEDPVQDVLDLFRSTHRH